MNSRQTSTFGGVSRVSIASGSGKVDNGATCLVLVVWMQIDTALLGVPPDGGDGVVAGGGAGLVGLMDDLWYDVWPAADEVGVGRGKFCATDLIGATVDDEES